MKKTVFVFFLLFLLYAGDVFAQSNINNAGFTPGNIWYSKDPFFAGDTVDIHTIVFNSGPGELSGIVEFYDNDIFLGEIPVTVPPLGGFKDVNISWKVKEGLHKIFAVIKEPKITFSGSSSKVSLDNGMTNTSEKFVAAIAASGLASSSSGYIGEKLSLIKEYADEKLPEPMVKTADVIGLTFEDMRKKSEFWADEKGIEARGVLNELKSNGAVSTIKKPFYYVYAFLSDALSYFFGNKYLFYGGLIVFVFLFLRFVKRSLFF